MPKKNKKIKALQRQIDELTNRITSLEDLITNIISKGFSAMFEENMEAYNNHFDEEGEDEIAQEEDFEAEELLFDTEEEEEEEAEEEKEDKKSKNKKKDKKKSKKKKHKHQAEEEEEEEEEEEADDFQDLFAMEEEEEEEEIEAEEESDNAPIVPNYGIVDEAPATKKRKYTRQTEKSVTAPKTKRTSLNARVAKVIPTLPINNLRHLNGIGDTLALKLEDLGVNTLEDLIQLSTEDEARINNTLKGFSKKMLTFNWKGQAQHLLDAHRDDKA